MVDSATKHSASQAGVSKLPDKKIKETKMAKKTARVYALDELKEKSQKALADPNLVDIARLTPNQAYGRAFEYVYGQTKDLQKTKELAVATRFLAMLRRDYAEEFEKLVSQKEQSEKEIKTETRKKPFHEIKFKLAHGTFAGVELITRESGWGHAWQVEHYIRFHADHENDYLSPREVGKKFYMEILYALMETATHQESADLLNDLTQLLEEKFGLKVKNCLNCHCGDFTCQDGIGSLVCIYYENSSVRRLKIGCELWTPKEVSEKNEN